MIEIRKDYILDKWVIVNEIRKKRPQEYAEEQKQTEQKNCIFCPGNEKLTPPATTQIGNPWKMRVIPNAFPALTPENKYDLQRHNKYYTFSPGYGKHEIIIETNDHNKKQWDYTEKEIQELLELYQTRTKELDKNDIRYVSVFKNYGPKGGASIVHEHSQIIAIPIIPSDIQEKIIATQKFMNCPYCEIVENEKKSDRKCFENEDYAAFCPYAPIFNFEIWVLPKKHTGKMHNPKALAEILKKIFKKLGELNCSYDYFIHYSPKGHSLHWQMIISPRIATWAGFEYSTGTIINSVSPESAAKFYRGDD